MCHFTVLKLGKIVPYTELYFGKITKVLRSLVASLKHIQSTVDQNGCQLLLIDMFQPVLTGQAGRQ